MRITVDDLLAADFDELNPFNAEEDLLENGINPVDVKICYTLSANGSYVALYAEYHDGTLERLFDESEEVEEFWDSATS